ADAMCAHARLQGRHRLKQPATRTLPQLRARDRTRGPSPHQRPVASIVARASDSWPTAGLIALTSPLTSGEGDGTEKRQLLEGGARLPLKLTLAWACSTTLPERSSSRRWKSRSIVASGDALTAPVSLSTALCGRRWASSCWTMRRSIDASASPHQSLDF